MLLQTWRVMIAKEGDDSDSQFSCTDSQFTWRCCMLMYDGLMIWGFPSADLGLWERFGLIHQDFRGCNMHFIDQTSVVF